MAIRLEDDLHAQLGIIAQLDGQTVTDIIRRAIEAHIEQRRTAPELNAKADEVLAEIDREADLRRSAIASLFGDSPPEPSPSPVKRVGRRSEASTET